MEDPLSPPHPVAPEPDAAPRPPKQEQERATTDVVEVAPGVLRTQLPIEMPGLGHVNCYVMEDERGIAVVDPGLPGEAPWAALVDRLGRAGYGVGDVHTVVVTHSHPDHFGGASRLREESGADIVTHESFQTLFAEALVDDSEDSAALVVNSFDEQLEAIERYLKEPTPWGGRRFSDPDAFLERIRTEHAQPGQLLEPLLPTQPLRDGQTIRLARREWVAIHTPGHTSDHLCLYDPEFGVVFTGDHVLPSITPHIGGITPFGDALALFFGSLTRLAGMADVSVALPAHGHPFADLRGRAEHIIEHHEERLDIIRQASAELPGGTVNDFMRVLFRERSWGEMAESETYAHLEHLRELGEFTRTHEHGLARYRADP
ncbi:MAG TPA: MBL fold metallo-hydrolase [Ilumatobacter sp.]|nr:MBL fold metallo-hydrolase [Ilumatobacter sp.]